MSKIATMHESERKSPFWNRRTYSRATGLSRTSRSHQRTQHERSSVAFFCSLLFLLSFIDQSIAFSTEGYIGYPPANDAIRNAAAMRKRVMFLQSSRDWNQDSSVVPPTNDVEKDALPSLQSSSEETSDSQNMLQRFLTLVKQYDESFKHRPPPEIEDASVLLYDIFLLINLTASVSFWVVHRMDITYIAPAISEGSLLSLLWVASGLYSGAFLYTAVDGHRPDGGPRYASMLALNTFVNAMNLRLLFALGAAVLDHRPVGTGLGEDLIGLELGFGLVLMTVWRALHSKFVPRI